MSISTTLLRKVMNPAFMEELDEMLIRRYTDPRRLKLIENFIVQRYTPKILSVVLPIIVLIMIIFLAKHVRIAVLFNNPDPIEREKFANVYHIIVESSIIGALCFVAIGSLIFLKNSD